MWFYSGWRKAPLALRARCIILRLESLARLLKKGVVPSEFLVRNRILIFFLVRFYTPPRKIEDFLPLEGTIQ